MDFSCPGRGMKLLITGGAGFIGSNLIRHLLRTREDVEIVNLDLLTYAGNLDNLTDISDDRRYSFVHGDICDGELVRNLMADTDGVIHLAAESHVDRSIVEPAPFIRTNVIGTHVLLTAALDAGIERFVHVSTDEVYGELEWVDPALRDSNEPRLAEVWSGRPRFTESTPLAPRSPYSASKGAGDLLALAYHETHSLPVVIVRCSNNYGPYQLPEKLIPLMVTNALQGKELPVYGDGLNVRDWIHVEDHCRGLVAALEKGEAGEVYNLGGDSERTNIGVVKEIVRLLEVSPDLIRFVDDRPGHDRRYAIDFTKARQELDWEPLIPFEEGLGSTVDWYVENEVWWRNAP